MRVRDGEREKEKMRYICMCVKREKERGGDVRYGRRD